MTARRSTARRRKQDKEEPTRRGIGREVVGVIAEVGGEEHH
jgi:hypothetical protein